MNSQKTLMWGVAFLFVVVAGIFALSAYHQKVYAELSALKLVPEVTPYTELYFQNSSALPHEIQPNRPLSFSFTIHNVEGATTTYPYQVYLQYPSGQRSVVVRGTTTLVDNESITVPVNYMFHFSSTASEIGVNLPSLNNQQIDFLLSTTPSP